jgi:hypothetical protein
MPLARATLELVNLGRKMSHYGTPQDIEWAYAGTLVSCRLDPTLTVRPTWTQGSGIQSFHVCGYLSEPISICVVRRNLISIDGFHLSYRGSPRDESCETFYNQPYFNGITSNSDRFLRQCVVLSHSVNPFGDKSRAQLGSLATCG